MQKSIPNALNFALHKKIVSCIGKSRGLKAAYQASFVFMLESLTQSLPVNTDRWQIWIDLISLQTLFLANQEKLLMK